MFGNRRKQSTGLQDLDTYVLETITQHLGASLSGHQLELAYDLDSDGPSIVVDDTLRVLYECGTADEDAVPIVLFQGLLSQGIRPTPELIREVAFTNKYMLSIELQEREDGTADLAACGGVMLVGEQETDAAHMAAILRAIIDVGQEAPHRYSI